MKFIVIEKINENILQEILINLANLYSDTGFTRNIGLYKRDESSFLVAFENEPDFERFAYFVNYIKYPADFENLNHSVIGFCKSANSPSKILSEAEEWLELYLSKNDTEYDNVYIVTDNNKHFIYDFGGKIKSITSDEVAFTLPIFNKENFNHIIDVVPKKVTEIMEIKPWWKFW